MLDCRWDQEHEINCHHYSSQSHDQSCYFLTKTYTSWDGLEANVHRGAVITTGIEEKGKERAGHRNGGGGTKDCRAAVWFGAVYKVIETYRVSQLNLPIVQCTCGWWKSTPTLWLIQSIDFQEGHLPASIFLKILQWLKRNLGNVGIAIFLLVRLFGFFWVFFMIVT